jgi:hypothetical protein
MFSRLREHFGTAGLVVAIVALVAALGGGAYAASGGSGGGKATASAKGKQGPRGKTGKTGSQGPAGPAGPTGPAGPAGPAGAKGDAGAAGNNGTNGASATTTTFNGNEHGCEAGGVIVKSASPEAFLCNGKKGTNGTTGFTETLPSGKTETGTWAAGDGGGGAGSNQLIPISFPIPLEEAPELTFVWLTYEPEGGDVEQFSTSEIDEILEEGAEHGCPGFEEGVPLADPGHLCVYSGFTNRLRPTGTGIPNTIRSSGEPPQIYSGGSFIPEPTGGGKAAGVNRVGTTLEMKCVFATCQGLGVWAVTAE